MSETVEPTLIVLERNRGGRPPAPEPGIRVSTWIPESHFDRLNTLADLHGLSISKFVGRAIRREIDRSIA